MPLKNRTVVLVTVFAVLVVIAAFAAMIAGRETVNAVIEDAVHWFHYFAGPIRRG
jgi:hypothetical protein